MRHPRCSRAWSPPCGPAPPRRPRPSRTRTLDAHAHLTDARFNGDLEAVLARAASAGVTRILTCGEDVASSEAAIRIARSHPAIRVAVGVHPHRAASLDAAAVDALRGLAADRSVVAIGEIGIDLSGRSAPRAEQERAFLRQLDLADELGLPVVVHVRDAGAVVRELLAGRTLRGQLHCYSEGPEELALWRGLGLVPSFAGPVTYRANRALRAAVRAADALLVETDAPYLAPDGHRGERNEPAFVAVTYRAVAAERGADISALSATTDAVAAALFGPRW